MSMHLFTVIQIAKNVNNFIKSDFPVKVGSQVFWQYSPCQGFQLNDEFYFIVDAGQIQAIIDFEPTKE